MVGSRVDYRQLGTSRERDPNGMRANRKLIDWR